MLDSLDQRNRLPGTTRVCCTHEHTLSDRRYARAVEPGCAVLLAHLAHGETLRARVAPTLPSERSLQRQIKPFLLVREPSVRRSLEAHG
jgi:hydroxyacylglutathione hydrolase